MIPKRHIPKELRKPSREEIHDAWLHCHGFCGYSITKTPCPKCKTAMVATIEGLFCVCGYNGTL